MPFSDPPAELARRFVQRFNRHPANDHARPFAAFSPEIQQRLLRLAEVSEEEVPAIAEYHHDARWVLLTSHHLIWPQDGMTKKIPLKEMERVDSKINGSLSSNDAENARHQSGPPPQFIIHTAQETLTITLERAASFWGWGSVLDLVERMCFNERLKQARSSSEAIIIRMEREFRRKGGEGQHTRFFAHFEDKTQRLLARLAGVYEGEVPIIAGYFDEINWLLLTSHRLIWSEGGVKTALPLTALVEADTEGPLQERLRARFPPNHQVNRDRPPPHLTITTQTGKMSLPIESGAPFFGIWNVLRLMPWLNGLGRLPSFADLSGASHAT